MGGGDHLLPNGSPARLPLNYTIKTGAFIRPAIRTTFRRPTDRERNDVSAPGNVQTPYYDPFHELPDAGRGRRRGRARRRINKRRRARVFGTRSRGGSIGN
ncbi:hypothetical protein EVAR_36127_1 [Eumeta japonica]|uniref:Uncharacterized protein n=1 Tax=Eumeta variegata TaxID=151549 RepID=A0A4C1X5J1_EUMVA|nr:hypothetical protein EVAR_36127_1 [Eumeta japonica]